MWAVFIVGTLGLLVSAISFYLKKRSEKKYGIKEKQKEVKEKQKEMKELLKSSATNPKAKEKADKLQKEIMELSMSMMKGNMSNMIYLFIIGIIILFIVQIYFLHAEFPVGKFLGLSPALVWYILVAIVSGIYYSVVFNLLEKRKVFG